MNTILYLTPQENETLKTMKFKYKLSISTICEIIWENCIVEKNLEQYKTLRIYEAKREHQRHIKPQLPKHFETEKDNFSARVINNFVCLYLKNELKQHVKCRIIKQLKETKEDNWDYNIKLKQTARMLKRNKEYFKKYLED